MNNRVTIGFCNPGTVDEGFRSSLWRLAWSPIGRKLLSGDELAVVAGANVSRARNRIVTAFLDQSRDEWLWMLDCDVAFPPSALHLLHQAAHRHERPVVGGVYQMTLSLSDPVTGGLPAHAPCVHHVDSDGRLKRVVDLPPAAVVDGVLPPAGCVLFHRDVLQAARHAAEHPEWPVFAEWIDPAGRWISEDLTAMLRLTALGFPPAVHTGVQLAHRKTVWLTDTTYRHQEVNA